MTVGDAAAASGTPETTALRAIQSLIGAGELVSSHDPIDGRRKLLHLTPKAKEQMEKFIVKVENLFDGRPSH